MQRLNRYITVGDIPAHYARQPHLRCEQVLFADDVGFTWGQIHERSSRVANAMLGLGLQPGARVATLLPNCAEYVELMYGIAKAGLVIVPLNSRYVAREVLYGLNFVGAEVLITTPAFADTVRAILDDLATVPDGRVVFIADDPPFGRAYSELIAAASPEPPDVAVDEGDLYWMPFTSGTTGNPKAAMVNHRSIVEHWRLVSHAFEVTSAERLLIAGPFYHSLGFVFGLMGLYAGGKVVIHSEFDPRQVLETIQAHGITAMPMVPTMYTMLLASEERTRFNLASVRKVMSAGSPLLTGTKLGLLELFSEAGLYEFYGSTEVGVATLLRPEDQRRKERCVGQPALGCDISLVDENGAEVRPGEVGEICKRGMLLGPEYFRNEAATAEVHRDGWMSTGDLGRFDEEGYLYIVDRKKDMIISGGANIFPAEIEEVISKHPGVLEVAVIGVPDSVWGEAVKAIVVPRPGVQMCAQEILDLCRTNLSDYKKPRSVEFVDVLPKTGTGKILKRELRERWVESERRVD